MLQQTASCSYSLPAARLGDRRPALTLHPRTCSLPFGCKTSSRHHRRTAIRVQVCDDVPCLPVLCEVCCCRVLNKLYFPQAALEQGVFLSVLQQGAAFGERTDEK